jgi:hypothetical protein
VRGYDIGFRLFARLSPIHPFYPSIHPSTIHLGAHPSALTTHTTYHPTDTAYIYTYIAIIRATTTKLATRTYHEARAAKARQGKAKGQKQSKETAVCRSFGCLRLSGVSENELRDIPHLQRPLPPCMSDHAMPCHAMPCIWLSTPRTILSDPHSY